MARTSYLLALSLLLLLNLVRSEDEKVVATPNVVVLPAIQTSVTSTAFNPNIQNPGGTTNSAGTFNVPSLARSSSFAGAGEIPKTTSFVVSAASFAPSPSLVTPGYLTETQTSSIARQDGAQSSATQSSVQLVSSNVSVNAVSRDGAFGLYTDAPFVSANLGTYLITISSIVLAAVVAL